MSRWLLLGILSLAALGCKTTADQVGKEAEAALDRYMDAWAAGAEYENRDTIARFLTEDLRAEVLGLSEPVFNERYRIGRYKIRSWEVEKTVMRTDTVVDISYRLNYVDIPKGKAESFGTEVAVRNIVEMVKINGQWYIRQLKDIGPSTVDYTEGQAIKKTP